MAEGAPTDGQIDTLLSPRRGDAVALANIDVLNELAARRQPAQHGRRVAVGGSRT
jgi:hypothetical protein